MLVCGPGISYIMGIKCPHKDSNISFLYCVDIFGPHEENSL